MEYSGVSKQRNIGFYIITDHFVLNVNVLRKNYGECSGYVFILHAKSDGIFHRL